MEISSWSRVDSSSLLPAESESEEREARRRAPRCGRFATRRAHARPGREVAATRAGGRHRKPRCRSVGGARRGSGHPQGGPSRLGPPSWGRGVRCGLDPAGTVVLGSARILSPASRRRQLKSRSACPGSRCGRRARAAPAAQSKTDGDAKGSLQALRPPPSPPVAAAHPQPPLPTSPPSAPRLFLLLNRALTTPRLVVPD